MSIRKIKDWAWPYIKNFRTYIDIGASDGDTSFELINSFDKIIAFEPNPISYEILSKNKSIESFNVALGSNNGFIQLVVPRLEKPQWGSTSTLRNKKWTDGVIYDVELRTLDSYNLTDIDFIKIDVEQAELDVVQGSLDTINRCKPVIMFENKRHENASVIELLKTINYNIEWHKSDTVAYYT